MAKKSTSKRGGKRPGAGRPRRVEGGEALTVWLAGVDLERLRRLSEERGQSVSQYVRAILHRHVSRRS